MATTIMSTINRHILYPMGTFRKESMGGSRQSCRPSMTSALLLLGFLLTLMVTFPQSLGEPWFNKLEWETLSVLYSSKNSIVPIFLPSVSSYVTNTRETYNLPGVTSIASSLGTFLTFAKSFLSAYRMASTSVSEDPSFFVATMRFMGRKGFAESPEGVR